MPPGPGMFSTTTRWLSLRLSLSARIRAVTSATPPAPNGNTSLIGFSGQAARACGASVTTIAAKPSGAIRRVMISKSPFAIVRFLRVVRRFYYCLVETIKPRWIVHQQALLRQHIGRELRHQIDQVGLVGLVGGVGVENRYPITHAWVRLRRGHALSGWPPHKAALKFVLTRRPLSSSFPAWKALSRHAAAADRRRLPTAPVPCDR